MPQIIPGVKASKRAKLPLTFIAVFLTFAAFMAAIAFAGMFANRTKHMSGTCRSGN